MNFLKYNQIKGYFKSLKHITCICFWNVLKSPQSGFFKWDKFYVAFWLNVTRYFLNKMRNEEKIHSSS